MLERTGGGAGDANLGDRRVAHGSAAALGDTARREGALGAIGGAGLPYEVVRVVPCALVGILLHERVLALAGVLAGGDGDVVKLGLLRELDVTGHAAALRVGVLRAPAAVVLHYPLFVVWALGDDGLVGVVERGGRADHGGRRLRAGD